MTTPLQESLRRTIQSAFASFGASQSSGIRTPEQSQHDLSDKLSEAIAGPIEQVLGISAVDSPAHHSSPSPTPLPTPTPSAMPPQIIQVSGSAELEKFINDLTVSVRRTNILNIIY